MKHFRTYALVFLLMLSFNIAQADEEIAAPAEAAPAALEPAPAAEEVTTAADPAAADRAPASVEAPAAPPEEKPAIVPTVAIVSEKAKNKKWKNNGLRKVKSACDVMDNPEGKKIGMLKLDRKLWTDEIDKDGWYKVTRKNGPGFVKKECFEQAAK